MYNILEAQEENQFTADYNDKIKKIFIKKYIITYFTLFKFSMAMIRINSFLIFLFPTSKNVKWGYCCYWNSQLLKSSIRLKHFNTPTLKQIFPSFVTFYLSVYLCVYLCVYVCVIFITSWFQSERNFNLCWVYFVLIFYNGISMGLL